MEEEEGEEQATTLLVVREVSVYKIPPRSTSGSYRCAEWLQSDKIWSGRLRVVSASSSSSSRSGSSSGSIGRCEIRLEDPNTGELFATCGVHPGRREASVESVSDSSRYFVLRIDDGSGRHAFIGMGFAERNDAFDFNVALSDHEKYARREQQQQQQQQYSSVDDQQQQQQCTAQPLLDLRLKEGETMKINVKTSSSSAARVAAPPARAAAAAHAGLKPLLAPPPGSRLRAPLPAAAATTAASSSSSFSAPPATSATSAPSATAPAKGWAAF